MTTYVNVRSGREPEEIKIDDYHVYVRSNIHEIEVTDDMHDGETTTHTEWEYDENVYDKNEYIKDELTTLNQTIAEQDELLAMLLLGE